MNLSNEFVRALDYAFPLEPAQRSKTYNGRFRYRAAIGEIMWSMITTHPEMLHPVFKLSQFALRTVSIHYDAVFTYTRTMTLADWWQILRRQQKMWHIAIRNFALQDCTEHKLSVLMSCSSNENTSDMFTKQVSKIIFARHNENISGRSALFRVNPLIRVPRPPSGSRGGC
jgi:hypothetical protein